MGSYEDDSRSRDERKTVEACKNNRPKCPCYKRSKKRVIASGMGCFVSKPVNIDSVGKILHEYFPRPVEPEKQDQGPFSGDSVQ